jgi:homoserine acetyltransferase
LLSGALVAAAPALASARPCGGSGTTATLTGTLPDTAAYEIQCPPGAWNGTLFLYSHGYVTPGSPNPAQDASDPVTAAWLLGHGYAIAGSSYATTGWAVQQALPDQIATVNLFDADFGRPAQTIAWGQSLGGMITAGLIQQYPGRFSAALPMCGVLSGAVGNWNTALDAAFAFKQLIDPNDPSLSLVDITNPAANLAAAETAAAGAQSTAQGRARLALVVALGDTPGWFNPLSPEPASNDFAGQEANQYLWATQAGLPFAFELRAEVEARAGGNPSWNTGVNYAGQLMRSADFREVLALYRAAGLSLSRDLGTLNHAARISADPSAVTYLTHNITYDGRLRVPVLTLHTTGDGLVVPENEQAYRSVVDRAGDGRLLQQIFVHRAGHCAFTPAEMITAAQVLLTRLHSGHWDVRALDPGHLNSQAAGLGTADNVFLAGSTVVPVAAAFTRYQPTPYPRPYPLDPPHRR